MSFSSVKRWDSRNRVGNKDCSNDFCQEVAKMKKKILFAFTIILLFAFSARSYVEPDGFGDYQWGQEFGEFQSMGPLMVDDEDKDLALSVALEGPRSWKNLNFRVSPSYVFYAGRFEGVIAHGHPGQDEWEKWSKTLEEELGPPSKAPLKLSTCNGMGNTPASPYPLTRHRMPRDSLSGYTWIRCRVNESFSA